MAISRSQLVKELEPGLNALFGMEYSRYEQEHTEIFDQESSDRAFEEEVMLSGFGSAPVKSEGAGISYDTATEAYTSRYTHDTIALGFSITEEAIEDNLYDQLSSRYTKALARSMANTKQVKGADVLNTAFAAASAAGTNPGGDGVSLINTEHPLAVGGTFSNRLATDADLNETSLEQSLIDIAAFVDERGLKIAVQGRKLIIPKELQFTADRLMNSVLRTGTSDNDINAIRNMGMIPEGYVVNHFLTDTDAFFIKTDAPNGLKHFVRTPMSTNMEGDFDTGNVRYKARERYSFGFSDPRGIFGTSGAA
jgi:hypothetical protein